MKNTLSLGRGMLLLAVTLVLLASFPARADFITNGSFEAVQITTPYSTNVADIPGWTHTGDLGDALLWRAGPQCCGGTNTALAGAGDQFVTLGGGFGATGSAAWSQTVNGLAIGQTYMVNFLVASEGETPTQNITVGFTNGSSTASETFTSPVTSTEFWQNWGPELYTFVPTATSATLEFSVTNQQYDVGLDGVSLSAKTSPVPEPGNLIMVLTGLLGAAIALKHRMSAHVSAPRLG